MFCEFVLISYPNETEKTELQMYPLQIKFAVRNSMKLFCETKFIQDICFAGNLVSLLPLFAFMCLASGLLVYTKNPISVRDAV